MLVVFAVALLSDNDAMAFSMQKQHHTFPSYRLHELGHAPVTVQSYDASHPLHDAQNSGQLNTAVWAV